jgi:ankyrin repeat protein
MPIETPNKDGRTALMWACKNGHVNVVSWLLDVAGMYIYIYIYIYI